MKLAVALAGLIVSCAASSAGADAIKFVINPLDAEGTGFKDATIDQRTGLAFGKERLDALTFAANIWSSFLVASYEGETITVDASMKSFPDRGGGSPDALASAVPVDLFSNFVPNDAKPTNPAYMKDTAYGSALANHLKGADLNPDKSEISVSFNIDVDDPARFPNNHWYYATDGKPDAGGVDFVTTALHEITHGLDFISQAFVLTGSQGQGSGYKGNLPSALDRFTVLGSSGKSLPSLDPFVALPAALVSDDVFFNGSAANAANGGKPVKLFAPDTFKAGSSIAHLDPSVGKDLMLPGGTDVYRGPSPIDLGILRDIGWTVVPWPSPLALMAAGVVAMLAQRRRHRHRSRGRCRAVRVHHAQRHAPVAERCRRRGRRRAGIG